MRFLLLILILALTGCTTRVELQGHRGARGLLPENTLPAFAKALDIGVDVLELDTGVTKDGVVVIAHDAYLNPDFTRDKNGNWLESGVDKRVLLKSLTFSETQAYDVGRINPVSEYAKRFPQQRPVDGTRIPKLADLFAMVKELGDKRVRFNIETKLTPFARRDTLEPEAFIDALLEAIKEAGMMDRVSIQSFDWRTLKIAQQKAPMIPTVFLSAQQKFLDNIGAENREGSAWTAGLNAKEFAGSVPRMIKAAGGKIWSPYFGDLDATKVGAARVLGIRVIAWTVNNPKDIEKMLDLGVDGIISDYPDRVRAAMAKRAMALPTN